MSEEVEITLKIQVREHPKADDEIKESIRYSDSPSGHTIVYLSFPEETILDNVCNRSSRPYELLAPMIAAELDKAGINHEFMYWDQRAGCNCPCSPGFVLPSDRGKDIWATITGVKPRTDDDQALNILAQIANDPTMPPLAANTFKEILDDASEGSSNQD